MQTNAVLETITPEEAAIILEKHNPRNRQVDKRWRNTIADLIKMRLFVVNGKPIIFDVDGNLLDGQHRLSACVEAGIPIVSYVIRGIHPNTMASLGDEKSRTLGNVGEIMGGSETRLHFEIIRRIFLIKGYVTGTSKLKLTATVAKEYLAQNERSIIHSLDVVGNLDRGIIGRVSLVAWHFLFSHKPEQADSFVDAIKTGAGLAATSPLLMLRNVLTEDQRAMRRFKHSVKIAITIKAWNAFVSKKDLKYLRFEPLRESFPTIL